MKLIIAIVSNEDSFIVSKQLLKNNHYVTKLASSGGFLRSGNTTFLIGADDDEIDNVIQIIKDNCRTRKQLVPNTISREFTFFTTHSSEISVGGATLFIINVEQQLKL